MPAPPPSSIPDVVTTWRADWGGGATAGLAWSRVGTDRFVAMVLEAWNDRIAAYFWARGPWVEKRPKRGVSGFDTQGFEYLGELITVDRYPLSALFGLWGRLMRGMGRADAPFGIAGMLGQFAAADDNAWKVWVPPPGNPNAFPGPPAPTPLTLPVDAYRRRCPAEIWSLANPGKAGNVSRFAVHLGTPDTQSPAPPPTVNFGIRPAVTTPEAERKYAGQMFRHDGSAWKVADDQTLRPDVLEFVGFPEPGDTFGPWNAADLADQLDRCEVTFVTELPHYSGIPPTGSPFYYYGSITITDIGDAYCNSDGLTGTSHANIRTQAGPDPYKLQDFAGESFLGKQPMAIEDQYWIRTRYRCFSDRLALIPTGGGCRAQGFVWAQRFFRSDNGGLAGFSSFGDLVTENTWAAMGAPELVTGTYKSPQVGSVAALALFGEAGYVGQIGLYMNWAVEGGFKQSAVSG